MGNLSFKLKKFLQNKNTVTIIGTVLIVAILYIGYNYRIKQVTTPVKVPVAKIDIQPRTKITEDMIEYVEALPAMVNSSTIKDVKYIVGKWSNYNTLIPKGSLFYNKTVVSSDELPDSAFVNIPSGYTAYNLPVTTKTTYGNSIFPNNYIDIYLKVLDADGKPTVGKLIENVKVLAVKDKNGRHVFENSDEERTPAVIIFALPEDMHLLLREAAYLENVKSIAAEIIPVPTTESYSAEPGTIRLASYELKSFIELNTGTINPDEKPPVYDPGQEQ